MATEEIRKNIKSRIQLKRDTTANWNKAAGFIPLAGEPIIYTDGPEGKPLIKIGDDNSTVDKLDFVNLDTKNTAGAANLLNKKLFLIGAESQETNPITYSHQNVYIGTDGCIYSGGNKVLTQNSLIQTSIIDTHAESNTTHLGYFMNDLTCLRIRGGKCIATITGAGDPITLGNNVTDNWFDGTTSYGSFKVSATSDVLTIIVKSFQLYYWSNKFGIGFGNVGWRAKNIKWELGYATALGGDPADDAWVTIGQVTNNPNPIVTFSGSGPKTGNASSRPWNTIRITLTNFNGTSPRIAGIWSINYGSTTLGESLLPKKGGNLYGGLNIYGNIIPHSTNTYNLGNSNNRWKEVHSEVFYEGGTSLTEKYAPKEHAHSYAPMKHTHTVSDITDFPTAISPTAHNHSSEEVTAMTGYSKASDDDALTISEKDSLNAAIGKLEKALDAKGTSNLTIGTTATTAAAGDHTHDYSATYASKSHDHDDVYVKKNDTITGATKCKITYDAKGLVTEGEDLTAGDIPPLAISKITGLQTALDGKAASVHDHNSAYLGKTAKAADSDKLDGKDSSAFALSGHTHSYAGSASAGGPATSANKLATARKIDLSGAVNATEQNFDGTANISIPVTSISEAYLVWGGKNIAGDVSALDTALSALHSANRFSFARPAGITIEYSRDNGTTWTAYSTNDQAKQSLVSSIGQSFYIGGHSSGITVNDKLRITLNATNMGVYTSLKKLLINVSSNGASGCNVTIEKAMKGSETTFKPVGTYTVSGWSGWNSIPIMGPFGGGATQTGNMAVLRLTFSITALSSNTNYSNALLVSDILGFGNTYWSYPSTMAKTGHLYLYDAAQNATFPARVQAASFKGDGSQLTNIHAAEADHSKLADNVKNYAVCETAAATAAKTISITNYSLVTGSRVAVEFKNTNTASSPTLNISNTGAKAIYYHGSAINKGYLRANYIYEVVYDGAHYEIVGDIDTDTDTKVTQTAVTNSTTDANYPVLLTPASQVNTTTTTSNFDADFKYNPKTHTLTIPKDAAEGGAKGTINVGTVNISEDPSLDSHATNKLYVDTKFNSCIKTITAAAGPHINEVGTPSVVATNDNANNKTTLTFNYLKGQKGDDGTAAGFGTPTASVDANVGTPSVTVTASGSNTAKVFNFAFKNLKGQKGDDGESGAAAGFGNVSATVNNGVGTPSVTVSTSGSNTAKDFAFAFKNLKGEKGDPGDDGTSVTITSQAVEYQVGTSGTTKPTGTWQKNTVPATSAGEYLWTRTTVNYSNGKSTVAYSVSRNGNNGTDGNNGAPGAAAGFATAMGVTTSTGAAGSNASVTVTPDSTSPNTAKKFNFAFTIPRGNTGARGASFNYNWNGTKLGVKSSDESSYTYVDLKGQKGDNGNDGTDGKDGTNGKNGTSVTVSSTSVTYAESTSGTSAPTADWSETIPAVEAGKYLWTKTVVNYSDGKSTTAYSVSRNGTNGNNGAAAGFGNPTASITNTTGTPKVAITSSGPNTAKVFNFKFENLKGEKGNNGTTPHIGTNGNWYIGTTDTGVKAQGPKGNPGNDATINSDLTIQFNGGTQEGTNQFTFDGSANKSVNITPANIGAATASHTHNNYASSTHNHDSKYAAKTHTHNGYLTDVKVNGTSIVDTATGVAAIDFDALGSNYIDISAADETVWVDRTVNDTTYKAIQLDDTVAAVGVFNTLGQQLLVHEEIEGGYLYLCVGTAPIDCTIRVINGSVVDETNIGTSVYETFNVQIVGINSFSGYVCLTLVMKGRNNAIFTPEALVDAFSQTSSLTEAILVHGVVDGTPICGNVTSIAVDSIEYLDPAQSYSAAYIDIHTAAITSQLIAVSNIQQVS